MSDAKKPGRDGDTPITSLSGGYPMFQTLAEEIGKKLESIHTPRAAELRDRLQSIRAVLLSWGPQNQPTQEERKRLVDELIATVKEASALLPPEAP